MMSRRTRVIAYLAVMTNCIAFAFASCQLRGFKELTSAEEWRQGGAGWTTALDCTASTGFNCVNGDSVGGTCQGADGVACVTGRAPSTCVANAGVFDECTVTLTPFCPQGIILQCIGGIFRDKGVGMGSCGKWDDC